MVLHWWREQGRGWQSKAALNGLGALATGIALVVIGASKFAQGAWITVLALPLLVLVFLRIRAHYRRVATQLTREDLPPAPPTPCPRVVIPISGVHRGMADAVDYARSISKDVTAVYVELEPGSGERIRDKWAHWWPNVLLVVLPSPYRSVVGPLLDFLDRTDEEHADGQLATVVLPDLPSRG
jgi:hypothetical protein